MKTKYIFKSLIFLFTLATFTNCDSPEELINELQIDREFAPVDLSVQIRTQTTLEFDWQTEDEIDLYLLEISEDPEFNTLTTSLSVNASDLPIQVELEGETIYYARVKTVSTRGLNDSTYAYISAETLTEQIFFPIQPEDLLATQVTLTWLPNSNVTQIVISPGDIVRDLTQEEIAAGSATITGLTGETDYTAQILNNANIRGVLFFTTGIDIGTGTLVTPSDDLFQMVADAAPGDVLVLESGDYTSQTGTLVIDKSLTLRGLLSFEKPLLKLSISIVAGATDVSLIDLDLTGDADLELTDMVRYSGADNYNSLLVSGCNVHDYGRSFIAGNETDAVVQTITVENSIVTNVLTSGGDFFDFRNSDVLNVNFTTSTFNNCAPGRDFFRIDASGTTNGLATCNILLENCTLYACSNSSSRRLFYVRFDANDITSRNNLITDTEIEGYSDNSATDESITFQNNNYFNAPTLYDSSVARYDDSTSFTTLDPGYTDVANGDFSVANQSLIDDNVGDPRWLQ
ncbi:DUF5123 domain-containing protein [Sediminibacter sp. Hel_I_10]|uniref:DUF5123 domain-containing protein n=1 Tax=Sediminibacter sp. Hel_I_10 TaxID=1392490 RepID=UPI00055E8FB2|nr:DUF5123 domain-containing protein [Sediminibacter sp. Hel_I_10]